MNPVRCLARSLTSGYADFRGRSRRWEYFWFHTLVFVVLIGTVVLVEWICGDAANSVGALVIPVLLLAVAVPSWAVGVRRMHDADLSGWLVLLGLIPLGIGFLIMLVLGYLPGTKGPNRFGPDPRATTPLAPGAPLHGLPGTPAH